MTTTRTRSRELRINALIMAVAAIAYLMLLDNGGWLLFAAGAALCLGLSYVHSSKEARAALDDAEAVTETTEA